MGRERTACGKSLLLGLFCFDIILVNNPLQQQKRLGHSALWVRSLRKWEIGKISASGLIFWKFYCFRQKYLRFGLSAVSPLKVIWVRVDHGLLSKQIYMNQLQFQHVIGRMCKDFWGPVKSSCKKRLQIFFNFEASKKIFGRYLHHKGLQC